MGDMREVFDGMRQTNKEARQSQNDKRTAHLMELLKEGWGVMALTPYQFRVQGRLDVYTTWAKWHDIKTGRRGEFKGTNTKVFVKEWFAKNCPEGVPDAKVQSQM